MSKSESSAGTLDLVGGLPRSISSTLSAVAAPMR